MDPYTPPRAEIAHAPYGASAAGAPVTDLAIEMLRQTRPWVQLLSGLCFLGSVFMMLASVGLMIVGAMTSSSDKSFPPWLGIVYFPFALLYVYPGIKLWSYGGAISRLLLTRAPAELESALLHQKSFWKFCGITSIVVLVVYMLALIGAVMFSVMTAATHH